MRLVRYGAAISAVALPFLLMRSHLDDPAGQAYCWIVTAAAAAMLVGPISAIGAGWFTYRDCWAAITGFVITLSVSLGLMVAQNVSACPTLHDGRVLKQMRLSVQQVILYYYKIDMGWDWTLRLWMLWALGGLVSAFLLSRALRTGSPASRQLLTYAQCTLGIAGAARGIGRSQSFWLRWSLLLLLAAALSGRTQRGTLRQSARLALHERRIADARCLSDGRQPNRVYPNPVDGYGGCPGPRWRSSDCGQQGAWAWLPSDSPVRSRSPFWRPWVSRIPCWPTARGSCTNPWCRSKCRVRSASIWNARRRRIITGWLATWTAIAIRSSDCRRFSASTSGRGQASARSAA